MTSEQNISKNTKARRWCFTWNNPERNPLFTELPNKARFIIWQKEKAPTTGTVHFQGYIAFTVMKRFNEVRHLFEDKATIIMCNGTEQENIDYCTKSESHLEGPWQLGTIENPGKRTDLDSIAEEIKKTGKMPMDQPGKIVRYSKGFEKLISLLPSPWRNVKVYTIIGPTGCSKTRELFKRFEPAPFKVHYGGQGKAWFDGYNGQNCILFDEFEGQVSLFNMLQYLDPYGQTVEIKGSFTPARWRYIFICSNRHPSDWYWEDQKIVKGQDPEKRKSERTTQMEALYRKIGMEPDNGRFWELPRVHYPDPELVQSQRVLAETTLRQKLDDAELDYYAPGAMEDELPDDVVEWRRDNKKRIAEEISASLDHASPDINYSPDHLALVPAVPELDKSPVLGPNGSPPGYSHNNAAQIANDDGPVYVDGKLHFHN